MQDLVYCSSGSIAFAPRTPLEVGKPQHHVGYSR